MANSGSGNAAFQELAVNYEQTVDQELRKFWGVGYSSFVKELLQYADLTAARRVLDIATGTGLIPRTITADDRAGSQVVGLDITYTALAIGKQKISPAGWKGRIAFTCASALALPFAPRSFDCAICALATHHLDQDGLLTQMNAVLKPGGQILLADVVASNWWSFPLVKACLRLAAFIYFLFTVSPDRAWVESQAVSYVHTEEEWITALEKNGFTILRVNRPALRRGWWMPSGIMVAAVKK